MTLSSAVRTRLQRLAVISAIALVYLHNAWIGWRKWGDLLVDCGKEWDVAAQLARGEQLYVANRYFYGPLTPTVNGLLVRCFRPHVDVMMYAGLFVCAAMCVVFYRLSRCFMQRLPSALIAITFLYLFGFSQVYPNGICNFVLPYSQSATYGSLLALTSVLFLLKYARKDKRLYLACSVAFLVLTALTKLELFFAAAVAQLTFFVGVIWMKDPRWRAHLRALLLGAAVTGIVYLAVIARVSWAIFKDNFFGLFTPQYQQYSAELMGLLDIPHSLKLVAGSCGVLMGTLSAVLLLGMCARRAAESRALRMGLCAGGLLISGAAYHYCPFQYLLNATPLVLAGVVIGAVVLARKRLELRAGLLPHAIVAMFGLACLARIALNSVSYGFPQFFLLPPSLVVLTALWFVYVPEFKRLGPGVRFASYGAGCGMLLSLCASHLSFSRRMFEVRNEYAEFPLARLYLADGTAQFPAGKFFHGLGDWLSSLPKDSRVLMIPCGIGFTYVAGLHTPFRLHSYLPTDLSGGYNEDAVLEEWKAKPADYIVRMTTPDHPVLGGFGVRYAKKLAAYIVNSYTPVMSIGPAQYILVLKRNPAAAAK